MKEKTYKKGIKKRLFSVFLAFAMMLSIVSMSSITAYAEDEEYEAYLVPHILNSDGTEAEITRPIEGTYTYYKQGNTYSSETLPYNGVERNVDGEIRYYYKTLAAAIEAAQAGQTNGEYKTDSNPSGAIVQGTGTSNGLNSDLGKYTDTVVLLKDAEAVYNSGRNDFENIKNPENTMYGIKKGIILDLNGHKVNDISAGYIPDDQVLVIKNGTIGFKFDDESGVGHLTGTIICSGLTLHSDKTATNFVYMFASNHSFVFLDGNYNIYFDSNENPKTVKPRGGHYVQNPNELGVDIDFDSCHVEEDASNEKYPFRVVDGPLLYDVVLDVNTITDDTAPINAGSGYYGETKENVKYTDEIILPTLTRDGYVFEGWYTNSKGEGTAYTGIVKGLTQKYKETVTLYAKWTHDTHKFSYSSSDNKIIATCTKDGCTIDDGTEEHAHRASLTLDATSQDYSGSAVTASYGAGEEAAWKAAVGSDAPTINYEYKVTTDGVYEAVTETKNAGYYRASVTVDEKKAYVEFTINKVDTGVSNSPEAKTGLAYTGESQNLLYKEPASETAKAIRYFISTTNITNPEESAFTATTAMATNAGKYYVYYLLVGDDNYNSKIGGPIEVTIAKADQTSISSPTATDENIKATKITLTAIGSGQGVTKYAKSTTGTAPTVDSEWQESNVFTGLTKLTTYYFFAKYEGNANYNEIVSTGTSITTKDITNTTLDGISVNSGIIDPGITYDGSPVTPEEIYTGTPSITGAAGITAAPSYLWEGIVNTSYDASAVAPAMPGKYKLVVSLESDDYIGTQEILFAISKKNGPAAPIGLSAESANVGATNGKITGLDSAKNYEYSVDDRNTWVTVAAGSTEILNLSKGSVSVREKENDTTKAGNPISIVINEKVAKPGLTISNIDYINRKVKGLIPGNKYIINGTDEIIADANGEISIDKYVGTTIKIKAKSDGTCEDSDEVSLNLSRENALSGLKSEMVSANGNTNGQIENLDSNKKYQYRKAGTASWIDVAIGSTEITNLAEGKYEIRLAPTDSSFESVPITISVKNPSSTLPLTSVKGQVKNAEGNPENGSVVNILKGNELIATSTTKKIGDVEGSYEFAGIPNGTYNLQIVSANGNITTTQVVTIKSGDLDVPEITLPDSKAQSKLIIDTSVATTMSNEADFASAVVGGLNSEADAVKVAEMAKDPSISDIKIEMKMTPQENLNVDSAAKNAIESVVTSMNDLEFVDIKVEKTIIKSGESTTDTMTTTSTVFEVIVPYDYAGKTNVQVIRYHEGKAQAFDENDSKADCTMRKDEANGLLYFYTNQFSTYAIAYKNASSGSGTPGGDSGSNGSGSSGGTPILGNGFFFSSLWTGYTTSEAIEQSFTITEGKKNVPSGATLVVNEVKSNTVGYKSTLSLLEKVIDISRAYVYDIKLMKDGVKVQPDGMISVTGKIPDGLDESKVVVYRINDDNSYTKLKSSVKGKKVTFETDHFSHYVIAEEGKKDIAKSAKTGAGFLGL